MISRCRIRLAITRLEYSGRASEKYLYRLDVVHTPRSEDPLMLGATKILHEKRSVCMVRAYHNTVRKVRLPSHTCVCIEWKRLASRLPPAVMASGSADAYHTTTCLAVLWLRESPGLRLSPYPGERMPLHLSKCAGPLLTQPKPYGYLIETSDDRVIEALDDVAVSVFDLDRGG